MTQNYGTVALWKPQNYLKFLKIYNNIEEMLIKYTVPSDKSGMQNILCILLQLGKNEHTRQTGRIKSRMVIRILEGRKG